MVVVLDLEKLPAWLRAAITRYHSGVMRPAIAKELGDEFKLSPVAAELQLALEAETDRGFALLAASFLDARLGALLRTAFVDDEAAADELLENRGGLHDFSARIDACVCLGLLPRPVCDDLDTIRKIRNEFAHGADSIDFAVHAIKQRTENLKFRLDVEPALDPRTAFGFCVMGVLGAIDHAIEQTKHAPRPPDPNMATLRAGIEEGRRKINEATRRVLEREIRPLNGTAARVGNRISALIGRLGRKQSR